MAVLAPISWNERLSPRLQEPARFDLGFKNVRGNRPMKQRSQLHAHKGACRIAADFLKISLLNHGDKVRIEGLDRWLQLKAVIVDDGAHVPADQLTAFLDHAVESNHLPTISHSQVLEVDEEDVAAGVIRQPIL